MKESVLKNIAKTSIVAGLPTLCLLLSSCQTVPRANPGERVGYGFNTSTQQGGYASGGATSSYGGQNTQSGQYGNVVGGGGYAQQSGQYQQAAPQPGEPGYYGQPPQVGYNGQYGQQQGVQGGGNQYSYPSDYNTGSTSGGNYGNYGSGQYSSSGAGASTGGGSYGSYTVKRGDTLWSISQRHGTSVGAIKSANSISSNTIYPGQVINVPGA